MKDINNNIEIAELLYGNMTEENLNYWNNILNDE